MPRTIVVAGAGGFIGGHLVVHFLRMGNSVRAVDIKPADEWCQLHAKAENSTGPIRGDVRDFHNCRRIWHGAAQAYQLAADMGGMGFIENN